MTPADACLVLPVDFDECASIVRCKGWFSDVKAIVGGARYSLTFYDPARLGQEIENEMEARGIFFEKNLIVVRSVTRSNMEKALVFLVATGQIAALVAD
ncbi:hypothetical protein [Methylopila turkensis]|uniref:hypothetical protein n=1 Tax=Methylopila turkensis TaxID=1437816 RepID=UPI0022F30AE4|nr:hypothetical protein [Methylopila turkensis]